MKFWYDTEFLEDGSTIDLISIGIVSEDGREYYAISKEADWSRIREDKWLVKNVMSSIPLVMDHPDFKTREQIAMEVLEFLTADGTVEPELWAWYGAYDHVTLCQLWGKMIDLPKGMPMFTNDLRSVLEIANDLDLSWGMPRQGDGHHNALADARHLKVRYDWVKEQLPWMN
jgi:hypothetical protein